LPKSTTKKLQKKKKSGEGCFTCSIGENKGFTFNFNISQKWEINLKVLEHFTTLFSNGIVSRHSVENVNEFRVGVWIIVKLFYLTLIIIHYILKSL